MKRTLSVLFPYVVFAFLSLVSWNRWIEPYVDGGRELMVPWRIAHGAHLYRDVRYPYGPLAPLIAAGVEALAGRSLPARIALAAAIALAHIEVLRRLAGKFLSPGRASLATALAVGTFFFLRPGGCYLFPYSLDTSIAVTATAWSAALMIGPGPAQSAPLVASLLAALLARPETGLAVTLVAALSALRGPQDRLRRLAPALMPLPIAAILYAAASAGTPVATLKREGWLLFLSPPPEFGRVYSSFAGLDRAGLRSAELVLALFVLALAGVCLVTAAFLASRAANPVLRRVIEATGIAILAAAAIVFLAPPEAIAERLSLFPPLIRPVPLFVVGGAVWRVIERVLGREERGPFQKVPDPVLFLSGLFASRFLLAAGYVGPYAAFYFPLAALAGTAGVLGLADRAARSNDLSALPRLTAGALILFLAFRVASLSVFYRNPGWSKVETPAGSLLLPRVYAGATSMALAELARRTRPGAMVAGFPEAGFFQYALGRSNPLPEDQFFPGHLDARAEQQAIRSIEQNSPAAFVYVNVLTVGHGALAFGSDYLTGLDAAVRRLSRPVASFGPGARPGERIGDPGFFIEIRAPARP